MSFQAGSPHAADIFRTLSYYDIFAYPLSAAEVHAFLPLRCATLADTEAALRTLVAEGRIHQHDGHYALRPDADAQLARRRAMERHAKRHWRIARVMAHVIKRFPFVSAVFVTGTLSKNIAAPELDIDYFVVTRPKRLWIARTALIAFKKLALLNSKKYFCLNYFVSEDALAIPDRNLFTAMEIVHAKAIYNTDMFHRFLTANRWLRELLPNWSLAAHPAVPCNNRHSLFPRVMETALRVLDLDALDDALMARWQQLWERRYPDLSASRRDELFRVRKTVSKAHGPDFQTRILAAFEARCALHGVAPERRLLDFPFDARLDAAALNAAATAGVPPSALVEHLEVQPNLALR
jgi:hypothetical protein